MHFSTQLVRTFRLAFIALALPAVIGATACNPNSIGRPCINPNLSAATDPQISSPALECPSRLCLIQPVPDGTASSRNTCTATCESDGDCDAETKEHCPGGFACAVAVTVGNFCCRKLCVCKADLQPGVNVSKDDPTQIITPFACDPVANPAAVARCKNVKAP